MDLPKGLFTSLLEDDLLYQTGQNDRADGVSMRDGWEKLRKELGYPEGRTPARERYEDGFFGA